MTKLWYQDLSILLEHPLEFFPSNNLSTHRKANSIVRFGIYFFLLIILLKRNQKWLSVSVLLTFISIFLGVTEKFSELSNDELNTNTSEEILSETHSETDSILDYKPAKFLHNQDSELANKYLKKKKPCYKPTEDNPFMNFTLADYYKDPNRPKNCPLKEVRGEIREKFLKRVVPDPQDLWGKNISDRGFYTTPNTRVVNDQTDFANWCYSTMGNCKAFGKNCLDRAQTRTGTGMFTSV